MDMHYNTYQGSDSFLKIEKYFLDTKKHKATSNFRIFLIMLQGFGRSGIGLKDVIRSKI